jgi:EAL domain-containing protein (putative c-di-GMP-specific phosphodiesterase class I)
MATPRDPLESLLRENGRELIQRALAATREHLGMEVVMVSEFTEGKQVVRIIDGDAISFDLQVAAGLPLNETYCQRVMEGRLPNVIPDARRENKVKDLSVTRAAGIGSYIMAPILFSDGRLFGALCGLSHGANATLTERDARFMRVMARIIADQLEREELDAQELRRRTEQIRRLIRQGEPIVVFQPITDLHTGDVVGAESLARFSAIPRRKPEVWFAEAVAVGLGLELEMAAILASLASLERLPPGTYLSLNVSPDTASSSSFMDAVSKSVPDRIVVEMTEHARVDDYDGLQGAIEELRALGVRLAIDDAGAGFASFRHILRLEPHMIKLDLTLTRAIDKDPVRYALASSLVTFAESIGATMIAEGIETEREFHALRDLGVPYGQGDYIARPGPPPLPRRLAQPGYSRRHA